MNHLDYHNKRLGDLRENSVLSTSRSSYLTFLARGNRLPQISESLVDSFNAAYREMEPAAIKSFSKNSNGGVDYILTRLSEDGELTCCIEFLEGERVCGTKK